jgi:hypothetical protein
VTMPKAPSSYLAVHAAGDARGARPPATARVPRLWLVKDAKCICISGARLGFCPERTLSDSSRPNRPNPRKLWQSCAARWVASNLVVASPEATDIGPNGQM